MQDAIIDIFNKWKNSYSGTALIKKGNETLLSYTGGYAHKGFAILNNIDTLFDTASVTKVFTAVAILKLVEKRVLHLTDRITDIIELTGTMISTDVTIEHLLTHTSGIADDADEESGEDYADLFIYKPNYSIRNCKDFLPQFAYKVPNFKPGSDIRYNNCAFVLLDLAIEKITGMCYRDYVTKRIFETCGMVHSRFCAMDEVNLNTAEGYVIEKDCNGNTDTLKKNIYSYPPVGTADGGAYTTVGDLDIFIRSILDGKLLTQKYSELICRPHTIHNRPHRHGLWRVGYGFEFIEKKGTILCMYKEGVNAGVEAMCSFYPQLGVSVQLLTNENCCLFDLHRDLQQFFICEGQ